MKQTDRFKTFFNPSGFIEQHYIGVQTPESVIAAVNELVKQAHKLKSQGQRALILACVQEVPKIDISGKMKPARQIAVEAMKNAQYDRIAIYGNAAVQIVVNTLILIAGKRTKIRVFPNREAALKWLKSDT
jgi:hypothetical protein